LNTGVFFRGFYKKGVGKIAVFLTIWHCILSAELIKSHSFRMAPHFHM